MSKNDRYTRREIIEAGTIAFSAGCFYPFTSLDKIVNGNQRNLVLIHLQGGNDALNTVIPYNNPLYYKKRRNLAIAKDEILKLDGEYGLHPSLGLLRPVFKKGDLAFVLGVGYPNSSMSHELSTDVWNSGEVDISDSKKWFVSRDRQTKRKLKDLPVKKFNSFDAFIDDFSVTADSGIKVSHIEIDGFDTHSSQLETHSSKLNQLARGLVRIYNRAAGSNTLVFVYSEFGRSITPNEDEGTDHGEGGLLMLMGSKISGGIYGDYGDLSNSSDCLSFSVDFREIQKTLKQNWIDNPMSEHLLSKNFTGRINPV